VAAFFDSELTISERSVKPGAVIHNASLILGKQIVNILPEGYVASRVRVMHAKLRRSAILNPNKHSFCLNASVTHIDLPIIVNQTEPKEIEILRIDVETNHNETIIIKRSEARGLMRKARKARKVADPASPLELHYTVKKPGVYKLKRLLDESNLEVRPRISHAVVATCPKAHARPTPSNRCRNDLSDVAFEVEGIPPLTLKYRTYVGGRPREATELQGLTPEGYSAPLTRHTSQALIRAGREDVSWARSRKVTVALNETLSDSGLWQYAVEEVTDGLGNHVNYLSADEEDKPRQKTPAMQSLTVHERPKVVVTDCNAQSPLQVAKGNAIRLPLKYTSTGKRAIDAPHTIEYLFTPESELSPDGKHSQTAQLKKEVMRTNREQPQISASGLYTLHSISTEFCQGEVLEPASCLLRNPPEPELSLSAEDIVDKCAGNPIGLRVYLDLVGSPPFHIKYREQKAGQRLAHPREIEVQTLRSTIELTPPDAGHYTYTFLSIRDWVYGERPLHNQELIQDVKPSASAHFIEGDGIKQVCIDDTVEFDVALRGEGPWTLDYELVHNGKRNKRSVSVEEEHYTIKTQKLKNGGEYILSLASVTDRMGCKEPLKAEARVNVRHERPKAYFGQIDGKQAVMALQDKAVELPLRLTGSGPWSIEYENLDTNERKKSYFKHPNPTLRIEREGTYQLTAVRDSVCPGFVDEKGGSFSVGWIPRPRISIPESSSMTLKDGKYVRDAVCEGEQDAFDVSLSGT
jgi:nucleoporin POM152